MTTAIDMVDADLGDPVHAEAIVRLLDAFMREPMQGGEPLSDRAKQELIPRLHAHPACYVLLALSGTTAVGVAVCFLGFSTFNARPLINIHDIFVVPESRGRGVGKQMLDRIETKARQLGCCRLTLEVREDNRIAKALYLKFGFDQARYDGSVQEFWVKLLN